MSTADENPVARARTAREPDGVAAPAGLQSEIGASWQRCLAAGLDPGRPPPVEADERRLAQARERHAAVRRLATAEMESLYHQIAGTNFLIAFATSDGMLLDALADSSFDGVAVASGIRPGSLWTERDRGTNALGLVALTGRPATVHGPEHFFRDHRGLTCMAAPVVAPDGELTGILDASSDCRSRQRHTQALVAMAAMQIESGLFREHHSANLVLAFHSRGEYLRTLSAGLLALSPDGTILGANGPARFLLQDHALAGQPFDRLFEGGFGGFVDRGRAGERLALRDRAGSTFTAAIDNLPWPVLGPRAKPRASAAALPADARTTPPTPRRSRFIALDPAAATAVRLVEQAARRTLPILIRGGTGTGKELLARHAHEAAGRRGAFVPVNCAALPESLVEAELFGHAEGAFTGARRGGSPGLIAEADGGTLFLDEIGDMKPALQAVLLRLFDDWIVRPVGGGRPRRVEILLIAATHVDLGHAIAQGSFRADLYWRLAAVEAVLPPLAERRDLAEIARHLLAEIAPDYTLAPDALTSLQARAWPGNVRELKGVLTRMSLEPPERWRHLLSDPCSARTPSQATPAVGLEGELRGRILDACRNANGNVSATARSLGISRNRVYRALRGARGRA